MGWALVGGLGLGYKVKQLEVEACLISFIRQWQLQQARCVLLVGVLAAAADALGGFGFSSSSSSQAQVSFLLYTFHFFLADRVQ